MTFHEMAYSQDEHVLVTLDGAELLAHDAQTEAPKWRLTFAHPLVAVIFAEASALPGCEGPNPWRDHAAGRRVVAVDAEGGIHAIDPALGQETGTLGPFGKPVGVAAGAGGIFALATADRVFLWRGGERTEIPCRASAIAFSNDGATLAIGASDGGLRFLSVSASEPLRETFCAVVHGGISDLVQHPGGAWIVAGKSGVSVVDDRGAQRLDRVPAGVMRLRLDANGGRLAAQLNDRTVAVYAWPSLEVELRIEYVERLVRGLSFGSGNWLGIALDHGDGNKIDVVTSATHRTDTHPGRTHRSWLLSVRGKETILSAKEAEEIRRMKAPFHTPAPTKSSGNNAGRIGIGVAISVALLCLRVCALGSRHSSSYPPTSFDPGPTPAYAAKCDRACATQRLAFLRAQCTASTAGCSSASSDAVSAFAAGDCRRAKASLARIGPWPSSGDSRDLLGRAALSLAEKGLGEACASEANRPRTTKHTTLVRLEGRTLQAITEEIPEANAFEGEEPGAIWAAPDGTVFVSTVNGAHHSSDVHRRDKTGAWEVVTRRRSSRAVQLWGRSASDLYMIDGDSLAHLEGTQKTEILLPASTTSALGGIGEDVFVVGESYRETAGDSALSVQLHRRHGAAGKWVVEPTVQGLEVRTLWAGGGTLWGRAVGGDGEDGTDDHLLQRTANGRWTERKWFGTTPQGAATIRAVWVSPTGDAFVATSSGVFRSASGGASWSKTGEPADVEALWGRSNGDVYACTGDGLLHYDGKSWSATSYSGRASVIGGTATDVLLAVSTD